MAIWIAKRRAVLISRSAARQLSRDIPADAACLSDKAKGRDARKMARAANFIRNLKTKIENPLFQFHTVSRNNSCGLWDEQGRNSTNVIPWNCQINVACAVQFGLPEKFLRRAIPPQMSFSLKRSGSWKPRRNWSWCPCVTPPPPPPTAIRKSLRGDVGPGYSKLKRSIFHEIFYRHLEPNNTNVIIQIKKVFFPALCSCDRASWVKREERKPTRCNNIDGLLSIMDVGYWHTHQ